MRHRPMRHHATCELRRETRIFMYGGPIFVASIAVHIVLGEFFYRLWCEMGLCFLTNGWLWVGIPGWLAAGAGMVIAPEVYHCDCSTGSMKESEDAA